MGWGVVERAGRVYITYVSTFYEISKKNRACGAAKIDVFLREMIRTQKNRRLRRDIEIHFFLAVIHLSKPVGRRVVAHADRQELSLNTDL